MNNDLMLGTRSLLKETVRRVHVSPGRRVECVSGILWVTQDGDRRDVVLEAGEGFDFDRSGDALLSALADARYLLLDGCAQKGH
ncbi:MAG: DUF2917 domain-containing protein [Caldimonas sp.]